MISWLKGEKIDHWKNGIRQGIVLACEGVGYEIQLLPREISYFDSQKSISIWVHQVFREDGYYFFGFSTKQERDLFRTLIAISGVGPQMGMSLLEGSKPLALVKAIIEADINYLSKAHGVGKRTAERISVELKNKLSEFIFEFEALHPQKESDSSCSVSSSYIPLTTYTELQSTLKNLGYLDLEIHKALKAVALENRSKTSESDALDTFSSEDTEAFLKSTLIWLSQEAA